jgi:signal peptidase II
MSSSQRDARPWLLLVALLAIVLDRVSKLWVIAHVRTGGAITVIPRVFRITHVLNTGAAFSMFADSVSPAAVRWGLVGFSVFAVLIVGVLLWRTGAAFNVTSLALALILGGAIGNLYERIQVSHVTDFLEVHIVHYHWPDFNVADSAIVVGACLLLLEIFRARPDAVEAQPS